MPNDLISRIRSVARDRSQLKLDFEPSDTGELAEVHAAIERFAAVSEPVALDRLLEYFSGRPYLWEKGQTAYHIARLAADRKIHLADEGTRIGFMEALDHLSHPARWNRLQVFRPGAAGPSDLKAARQLCVSVFRRPAPHDQDAIAAALRRGLYGWGARLSRFRTQTAGGRFPGIEDIDACQRLAQALLALEDPYELIRAVLKKEGKLITAGEAIKRLTSFYKNQVSQWEALLAALGEYGPFKDRLEEEGVLALERLERIHRDPCPYQLVPEIGGLTATVKGAYRKLLADRRTQAEGRLDWMVTQVRLVLDRRGADPQLCNRALHPLRQIRAKLAWASRVPDIRSHLGAAEDHFDDIIEELGPDA